MSVKESLIEQRTQLVLQRAALKDQLEAAEKALGTVAFALQALEQAEKEPKLTEDELRADLEAETSRMANLD